MPRYDQSCQTCEWRAEILAPSGTHPPCPVCGGPTERLWIRSASVHGDDVPGGFWAENGFETPRQFYSRSEHIRALKEEGCEIRAKWAGPLDKHLTRWDAPSEYTLACAKALLERVGRVGRPDPPEHPEFGPPPKGDYPIQHARLPWRR
jgi:hypothetical protein